jgi:hypothetical protein
MNPTYQQVADQLSQIAADLRAEIVAISERVDTAGAALDQAQADLDALTTPTDLEDALNQIADLELHLAAVIAERDDARAQVELLESEVGSLEFQLAACEAGSDPDPDPMVCGPVGLPIGVIPPVGPGHEGAPQLAEYYVTSDEATSGVTRGEAEIEALDDRTLRIGMSQPAAQSSTSTHEQHFLLDPVHTLTAETTRRYVTGDLGKTGKAGPGFGGFDGNWSEWPGGGTKGPKNFMVRSTHWWWDRTTGTARLALLVKLGGPYAGYIQVVDGQGGVGPLVGTPRRYVSSEDWVAEIYVDAVGDLQALVDAQSEITVRCVASTGLDPTSHDGWLDTYVQVDDQPWMLALALGNIRWATELRDDGFGEGFNRGYLSFMYHSDEAFSGVVDFRDVRYWPGEVRPT